MNWNTTEVDWGVTAIWVSIQSHRLVEFTQNHTSQGEESDSEMGPQMCPHLETREGTELPAEKTVGRKGRK